MLNIVSVESFIKGSDEINRKRDVIVKVIGIIQKLIRNKTSREWSYGDYIVSVSMSNSIKFGIRAMEKCGADLKMRAIAVEFSGRRWWEHGIPYDAVPMIYDRLPDIIEATIKAVPETGLADYFLFFMGQAPEDA